MTLQQLLDAGLTEAQANAVLGIHKTSLDGNYVTKDRFNQVNEDLKAQKLLVTERDTQIETIKKDAKSVEGLEKQITDLQQANKETVDKLAADAVIMNKKTAVKLQLLADDKGKPHDVDMVVSMYDLEKIVLDDNLNIKEGFKEQHEAIRKDKSFLFTESQPNTNQSNTNPWWNPVSNPPADGGSGEITPEQKAVSFGAKLAQAKNQMMGVQPSATNNNDKK